MSAKYQHLVPLTAAVSDFELWNKPHTCFTSSAFRNSGVTLLFGPKQVGHRRFISASSLKTKELMTKKVEFHSADEKS